jgi:hypothetical protein
VEFVPKVVNNPEEEQSVDLPTVDDEERETMDDRILRKETSW